MTATKLRRNELLALALILLLAALLRLIWPTVTEFKLDEAQIVAGAWDVAELKSFPLYGTPSSIGTFLPPFGIYLYAIPLLFWHNPVSAVLFTAVCNVVAVLLCWWVGRRYWGAAAGLCAALWLATTPWAVAFSRKIWEPDLLPLLALGYIIAALLAFLERRPWALAAHLVLLAVIVQVHFSGIVLVPLTVLLLVRYRKSIKWQALVLGLSIAVLTAIPFLRYLWQDRHEVREAVARLTTGGAAVVDQSSLRLWWSLAVGSGVESLAGPQAFRDYLRLIPNLGPVRWALGLALAGGLGHWLFLALRRPWDRRAQCGGILALWALAPLVVFWVHPMDLQLHYYLASLPAFSLVFGYLTARVMAARWRALRWAAIGGLTGIAVADAAAFLVLLSFLGTRANVDGFGIPLKAQLAAVDAVRSAGLPIVVLTPGDDPACDEWAAVFDVLLRGTPHRLVDGRRAAVFPASPASLLAAPGVDAALRVYDSSDALEPWLGFAGDTAPRWFRLGRLRGEPELTLSAASGSRRLANGIEFVGYGLSPRQATSSDVEWWVEWHVRDRHSGDLPDYQIYNHLLDSKGKRWAQADAGTVRTRYWAQGDTVVQVFRLEIPADAGPGPYWMKVGMYTWPDVKNQPVLEPEPGLPTDGVMMGPLARN